MTIMSGLMFESFAVFKSCNKAVRDKRESERNRKQILICVQFLWLLVSSGMKSLLYCSLLLVFLPVQCFSKVYGNLLRVSPSIIVGETLLLQCNFSKDKLVVDSAGCCAKEF